jgi:hypothetical protein
VEITDKQRLDFIIKHKAHIHTVLTDRDPLGSGGSGWGIGIHNQRPFTHSRSLRRAIDAAIRAMEKNIK